MRLSILCLLTVLLAAATVASAEEPKIYSNEELGKYRALSDASEDELRAEAQRKCREKILLTGGVFFKPDQISRVDIFSEISSEGDQFEFLVSVIYHLRERHIDTQHFLHCTARRAANGEWSADAAETSKYGD